MTTEQREQRMADIRKHPERHRHTFDELTACCMDGGVFDIGIMEAHCGLCGSNGSACDTTEGPCSCGAWH